ncbi:MAG: hypothetical protein RSD77_08530 [Romboutsia sp.]
MEDVKIINFFDEKDKKQNINKMRLIVLSTILIVLMSDAIKLYEIKDLENEVNQRKQILENNSNDIVVNADGIHIKTIYKLIEIIQDNNIKNVEIDNQILRVKGQVQDSGQIKQYLGLIQNIDSMKEPNISSINRVNDIYEFEINAGVGVKSEN